MYKNTFKKKILNICKMQLAPLTIIITGYREFVKKRKNTEKKKIQKRKIQKNKNSPNNKDY